MSQVFGNTYAASYDSLYAEKDYGAECDLLEEIFAGSSRSVHNILDLGCGTGGHALRLAERGFDVVGVDLSPAMLGIARGREASGAAGTVTFVEGDIRTVRLPTRFDAVICMFAVLGYQIEDEDLHRALRTVREHLMPGGIFVFDVWYAPAVEAIRPSGRRRVVQADGVEIERAARAELDVSSRVCTVSYTLVRRRSGHPDEVAEEVHRMRYFDKTELENLLQLERLTLRNLTPFPDTNAGLSAQSWNVLATADG